MPFQLEGEYVATCNCAQICACAIDGPPTGKNGTCTGVTVFHIDRGELEGVDLSGVNVAMVYHAPGNFTAGNLTLGLVLDPATTDSQTKAVEQIFTGQVGGPFAEFVPLIGSVRPTERAPITFSGGLTPSAKIGRSAISVKLALGPDGEPTEVRNAMMAFRTEGYRIGSGSGSVEAQGQAYDSRYGEAAAFSFAS